MLEFRSGGNANVVRYERSRSTKEVNLLIIDCGAVPRNELTKQLCEFIQGYESKKWSLTCSIKEESFVSQSKLNSDCHCRQDSGVNCKILLVINHFSCAISFKCFCCCCFCCYSWSGWNALNEK